MQTTDRWMVGASRLLRRWPQWVSLPVLVIVLAGWGLSLARCETDVTSTVSKDSFRGIKDRFRQSQWQALSVPRPDEGLATNALDAWWIQAQSADGSWSDVNYASQQRSMWPAIDHLKRTSRLAALYLEAKAHGKDAAALRHTVLAAVDYWLAHDFRSKNWWPNQIGVPNVLSDILLMLEDDLPADQKAAGLKILQRSTLSKTGQNLVAQAFVVFKTAMLQGNSALAQQAYERIVPELEVSTREGLQPDGSFHQHGPQPQFGVYGLAFALEMTRWAAIWRGSPWTLSESRLAALRNFLLDGEGTVVANGTMDISACGRQLFPGSPQGKGQLVLTGLRTMAEADPTHAQDYQIVIQRDFPVEAANQPPVFKREESFNRNFYRSDYMVQRAPGFLASVRLCSRRVIGTERINGENVLGRYLADGVTFVHRTGQEYTDIFPVWDWRRIPGLTRQVDNGTMVPAGTMPTDFAGGVSDGRNGACGLDYNRDGVTGKKAWFFLDKEVVCLGAGLVGDGHSRLVTSVEQSLLRSDIVAGGQHEPGKKLGRELQQVPGARWVWQDNQGYIFPVAADVMVSGSPQVGAWGRIYKEGSDKPISKDVFSLWIEHNPALGGGYAYVVLPNLNPAQTAAYASQPAVKILANTARLQAVQELRSCATFAVFYAAGELATNHGKLTVDQPCALMLHESGSRSSLTLADPTQKSPRVQIGFHGTTLAVDLPQGDHAGESLTASLP